MLNVSGTNQLIQGLSHNDQNEADQTHHESISLNPNPSWSYMARGMNWNRVRSERIIRDRGYNSVYTETTPYFSLSRQHQALAKRASFPCAQVGKPQVSTRASLPNLSCIGRKQ